MHFIDKTDPAHILQINAEETSMNKQLLGSIFSVKYKSLFAEAIKTLSVVTRAARGPTPWRENALLFHFIFVDQCVS